MKEKKPMWRANTVKQISVDLAVWPSTFESHDDILVSPQRTKPKKEKKIRWFKRIFNFPIIFFLRLKNRLDSFAFCFSGLNGVKISECKKCGCVRFFFLFFCCGVAFPAKCGEQSSRTDYSIETIKPIKNFNLPHRACDQRKIRDVANAWKTMRQRRAQRDDIYTLMAIAIICSPL